MEDLQRFTGKSKKKTYWNARKKKADLVKQELIKHGYTPPPNMTIDRFEGGSVILDKLQEKQTSHQRGFTKGYRKQNESPEEYNRKTIEEILTYMSWDVVPLDDPIAIAKRVEQYASYCYEHDRPITNRGMYMATGISRELMDKWENNPEKYPQHAALAQKMSKLCSFWRENMAAQGKLNPLLTIWWQKNYDRMTDQQQVMLSIDNPLGNVDNIKALQEKYAKSAGVIESVRTVYDDEDELEEDGNE